MYTKEFKLKHVVKNCQEPVREKSEIEQHFGVSWNLHVENIDGNLAIYLNCLKEEDEQNQWSVYTKYNIVLASDEKTKRELSYQFYKMDGHGWESFADWENVMKNHVVKNCLTIECHVIIKKMTGCSPKRKINFEEPMHHLTDGVLKVGEKMFNVNKAQLAFRSPYFKTLFFGPTVPKKRQRTKNTEINYVKVDPDDFQCLLEVIYGEASVIQPENVEGLMNLADLFEVPIVREKCEKFLLYSDEIEKRTKIRLADKFDLEKVMTKCLESITSGEDLKESSPSDVSVLKPSTVQALYEKSISLH